MPASCDAPGRSRSNALDRRAGSALERASGRMHRRAADPSRPRATDGPTPRSNALDRGSTGPPGRRPRRAPTRPRTCSLAAPKDPPPARSNALDRRPRPTPPDPAAPARTPPFEGCAPPETTNPGRAGVVGSAGTGRPGLTVLAPSIRTSPRRTPSPWRSASRRARSVRWPTAAASGRTRSGLGSACCETPPGP